MTLWDVQFGRGKVNVVAEDASDGRGLVVQSPRRRPMAGGLYRDGEIGLAWIQHYLSSYDLSLIDSIRIERGRSKKAVGVYGKCFFPTKDFPLYRMTCMIPGPFPCRIVIRKPPLYRNEDGSYPPVPKGCRRGLLCVDKRTGRQWYRMISQTQLNDLDEAIVWIMAHEAFHYLRKTKQVPGRNNEIQADAYGDDLLVQFQQQRASFTPPAAVFAGKAETPEEQANAARPTLKPKPVRVTKKKTTRRPKPDIKSEPKHDAAPQLAQSTTNATTTEGKAASSLVNVVRGWMGLWAQPPEGKGSGNGQRENSGKNAVRVKRK